MFDRSDKIGIDAPFGWPTVFAVAVDAHPAPERMVGGLYRFAQIPDDGSYRA